jgi:hypothetical protein
MKKSRQGAFACRQVGVLGAEPLETVTIPTPLGDPPPMHVH